MHRMSTTLQEHGTTSSTRPATPPTEPARLRWLPYVVAAVLLPLVYLFLVHQVGSYPILVWDEGRVAVNAADMD